MKIAIDARYLGVMNSALARHSESLLQALAQVDDENEYLVHVNSRFSRKLKLGDNFEVIPVKGSPTSIGGMRRLAMAVRRERPDMLHVHFPLLPPFIDCPVLLTVHDVLPFTRDPQSTSLRSKPLRWMWTYGMYPFSLRRAAWIHCVSQSTRAMLTNLFPEMFHKSFVVRSGVNDAFSAPVEKATRDLIRQRLELPGQYLFYSGSARADKNVGRLIRTFARLRSQEPERHGALSLALEISCGSEGLGLARRAIERHHLEDWVRVYQDVGEEERRVLFEDARAFCIFSRFEGFGAPALEAQLARVPVVAADRGALPEILGESGAVYIDPDKIAETVKVLDRVLTDEDLRSYLIAHGRKNALRFDWEETAERMKQVYELVFHPRDALDSMQRRGLTPAHDWPRP